MRIHQQHMIVKLFDSITATIIPTISITNNMLNIPKFQSQPTKLLTKQNLPITFNYMDNLFYMLIFFGEVPDV